MKVRVLFTAIIMLFMCSFMSVKAMEIVDESVETEEITVVVDKVENFKAKSANQKKVTLSWDTVEGADGYEIYRSTEVDVRGDVIMDVTSGETVSYHDTDVKTSTYYYYSIRAYKSTEEGYVYGEASEQVKQRPRLKAAKITSIKRKNYKKIEVKWDKLASAEGYYIYRSESESEGFERIARVSGQDTLSYTDEVTVCGRTYYYKVAGYMVCDKKKCVGKGSAVVSMYTKPTKVQFTDKTVSKSESVTLRWKESAGAIGYAIYRSTEKDSGYSRVKVIKDVDTLKWTNKELDAKTVYYYKVRPYTKADGKTVYATCSNPYEKQLISKEIEKIKEYTYVKYVSGGSSTKGWDCSGFTQWVYKNIYGKSIPRSSKEQAKAGKSVGKSNMSKWKPGDILVYSKGGSVNHVGLYLGDGKMMHALNKKYGTVIQDVEYYESWDSKNNLKDVRRCL